MKNASLRLSFAVAVSLSGLFGQQTLNRQNVADILGFENGSPGAFPAGWSLTGGDRSEISIDDKVFMAASTRRESIATPPAVGLLRLSASPSRSIFPEE